MKNNNKATLSCVISKFMLPSTMPQTIFKTFGAEKFYQVTCNNAVIPKPSESYIKYLIMQGLRDPAKIGIQGRQTEEKAVTSEITKSNFTESRQTTQNCPIDPESIDARQDPPPQAGPPDLNCSDHNEQFYNIDYSQVNPQDVDPGKKEIPQDEKLNIDEMQGYSMAVSGAWSMIFRLAGHKQGINMDLTDIERDELVKATLPVLGKYVNRDFSYGEEVRLGFAVAGVWSNKKAGVIMSQVDDTIKKTSFNKESEPKKNQDEIITADNIPPNLLPFVGGDLTGLEQMKDTDITKNDYEKMLQFTRSLGIPDYDRKMAAFFLKKMNETGFTLDLVQQTVKQNPDFIKQYVKGQGH